MSFSDLIALISKEKRKRERAKVAKKFTTGVGNIIKDVQEKIAVHTK